ncbi:unnamed protein product [Linum trigynum]|uniref:Gnk2-homologous domain-containing protein n=1 Tax=Linum trigynum TaxID=586398 RepID=A0AAV2E2M5_9ROSI
MANSSTPFFLPLLFILITTTKILENVRGDPDLTFISALCGSEYDATSFRKGQATRLTDGDVKFANPRSPFCSVTADDDGTFPMYGRATCSDSISPEDCTACIAYCKDQLVNYNICSDLYGAQINVASCSLRYETYAMDECTA